MRHMDGHTITTEPAGSRRVARTADGTVLADSTDALLLHETGAPVRTYFPREDVRLDLLERTDHTSHCPFKGDASYWSAPGLQNVVWSYEAPLEERADIQDRVAFWDGRGVEVSEA
jgi:uncharacterized protein (DUF427 family)